ncbi:MAG: rhodanese-like domain-containing protein [Acidimicrobiia bacterium]
MEERPGIADRDHLEGSIRLDDMLDEARSGLQRVPVEALEAMVESGALLVDIRTSEQRERDGLLPGAEVIDLTVLEWRLAPTSPHRIVDLETDRPVILVCSEGYSSSLAAARLQRLGLVNATDLIGGHKAWRSLTRDGALARDTQTPETPTQGDLLQTPIPAED